MKKQLLLLVLLLFQLIPQLFSRDLEKVKLLILSGRNNHEWQQTTGFLENMFHQTRYFRTEVTNQPDTLKLADLQQFDVVLSNWNSWPENDLRWPAETEKALLQFIKSGGGFVTFHSSTSVFYNWPEFQEISTGAWIADTTNHGKPSVTRVEIINENHPVTKGLMGFEIFDELWINASKNNKFEVLGTATNDELIKNGKESQPAIMVAEFGKGRIFHTILGHDINALENEGFQTLMLRGTEWVATGKVSKKTAPLNLYQNK
ncbi:MAG: ThuA domain-containing protein [Bacteroidetes bacterium]|nr:MAG: ThuA domain-containing protein [Bacteroidota bacterium]